MLASCPACMMNHISPASGNPFRFRSDGFRSRVCLHCLALFQRRWDYSRLVTGTIAKVRGAARTERLGANLIILAREDLRCLIRRRFRHPLFGASNVAAGSFDILPPERRRDGARAVAPAQALYQGLTIPNNLSYVGSMLQVQDDVSANRYSFINSLKVIPHA